MRQAVLMLVHHPKIATLLNPARVAELDGIEEPGAEILRALVADLRDSPCASTGQLLERWRDRPEAQRFNRLAAVESLMEDDRAALRELDTALGRMRTEADLRRADELIAKERDRGLSPEEKQELQRLMAARAHERPEQRPEQRPPRP
jgi:DNA primase